MPHYCDERVADDGFEHIQINLVEILEVEASDARCVLSEPSQLLGVSANWGYTQRPVWWLGRLAGRFPMCR